MKNDNIEHLLQRYREGTISDSELADLNRLTHRDEVMERAGRQAAGIVHRRRTVAFTLAGLLVAGAATWTLLRPQSDSAPQVAEASMPELVAPLPEPTVEQVAPSIQTVAPERTHMLRNTTTASAPSPNAAPPTPASSHITSDSEEPVVMCNNQCVADSVINDIWKFLTV